MFSKETKSTPAAAAPNEVSERYESKFYEGRLPVCVV